MFKLVQNCSIMFRLVLRLPQQLLLAQVIEPQQLAHPDQYLALKVELATMSQGTLIL